MEARAQGHYKGAPDWIRTSDLWVMSPCGQKSKPLIRLLRFPKLTPKTSKSLTRFLSLFRV